MKYDIAFIKGKNLITKSVDDLVLTGWFECGIDLYSILHRQLNKPLKIIMVNDEGVELEFNSNINTDTKNYIGFVEDHGVFKLDIMFPDILLSGFLFKSKLFLTIEDYE